MGVGGETPRASRRHYHSHSVSPSALCSPTGVGHPDMHGCLRAAVRGAVWTALLLVAGQHPSSVAELRRLPSDYRSVPSHRSTTMCTPCSLARSPSVPPPHTPYTSAFAWHRAGMTHAQHALLCHTWKSCTRRSSNAVIMEGLSAELCSVGGCMQPSTTGLYIRPSPLRYYFIKHDQ